MPSLPPKIISRREPAARNGRLQAAVSPSIQKLSDSGDRAGRLSAARAQSWTRLSEVGFHHVDHLISRVRLLRIRFPLRVKHMVPDVAFQELSH